MLIDIYIKRYVFYASKRIESEVSQLIKNLWKEEMICATKYPVKNKVNVIIIN